MNKKRHTIKLVILISIFAVIITAIAISSKYINKKVNESKDDDIKTDMLVLQAKIKVIKGESEVNKNTDNYLGIKVNESNNENIINLLKSINIPDEELQNYYILNNQDVELMGISEEIYNKEDSSYIVNYNSAEVIYKDGIFIDGVVKYKLSDLIENTDPKNEINNNIE